MLYFNIFINFKAAQALVLNTPTKPKEIAHITFVALQLRVWAQVTVSEQYTFINFFHIRIILIELAGDSTLGIHVFPL